MAVPYTAPVPSFGEDWGFVLAYDECHDDEDNDGPSSSSRGHPADVGRDAIDGMIEGRIVPVSGVPDHASARRRRTTTTLRGGDYLRHYDGIAHGRLFALSKPLRQAMEDDERVMTEANPIFMY